jgi:23S rRNA pseudouridine1911/1915/1917 synthase
VVLTVPASIPSQRIDTYLSSQIAYFSRSRLGELIDDGYVTVNGHESRRSKKIRGGETIVITIPPLPEETLKPVDLSLEILYEDGYLAVIDKPAGLVVHPGSGTEEPTLVHGLLHRYPDIIAVGDPDRPGIVHRLDKDTSGCIIIARTEEARLKLIGKFSRHTIHKEYYTLVKGVPGEDQFSIDKQIGRNLHDRKKMSVHTNCGREALTHISLVERFGNYASALAVRIVTGRTHQIRVHLAYAGFPVLGDYSYGKAARALSHKCGAARQMLHAHKLSFRHPVTREELTVVSPLPEDMRSVEETLRTLNTKHRV